MKILKRTWKYTVVLSMVMLWLSTMTVFAAGDNSLSSLGIENGDVSPEFYYSTTTYDVTVPAGTQELILDPKTTDSNASITSIDGTKLDNGNGTVTITVAADDGSIAVYTLNVAASGEAAVTEATTQAVTEKTVPETQKAVQETQPETDNTAALLRTQVTELQGKVDLSMKILYGMIAFAVVLLFIIINLILKNKDLKDDLRDAENNLDLNTNEFARKEKSLSTDYYYAPVQEMQPESANAPGAPIEKVQDATEQAFGNVQAQAKAVAVAPAVPEQKAAQTGTNAPRSQKPQRKSKAAQQNSQAGKKNPAQEKPVGQTQKQQSAPVASQPQTSSAPQQQRGQQRPSQPQVKQQQAQPAQKQLTPTQSAPNQRVKKTSKRPNTSAQSVQKQPVRQEPIQNAAPTAPLEKPKDVDVTMIDL